MSRPYEELCRDLWPHEADSPGWTIRAATEDDAPALARLGSTHPVRTLTTIIAVDDASGDVHAAFGTTPVTMRTADGGTLTFGAITTWLEPAGASDETEQAPLIVRCARRHAELFGTPTEQVVTFGPLALEQLVRGRRAGAPGNAMKLEVLRTDVLLTLPRENYRDLYAGFPSLPVEEPEVAPEGTTELHARLSTEWGVSAVRDPAWYATRFAGGDDHRFGCVRGPSNDLRAIAVALPQSRPDGGNALAIADWLCEPFDYDAGLTLLRWAIDVAEAAGAEEIVTMLPPWTPWFSHLQWNGLSVREPGTFVAGRSGHRQWSGQFLRDRWYLTMADLRFDSLSCQP